MAKKKTVLLIDDEQGFLEALVDALTFEGVDVVTARTGHDGLEILGQKKIDLVTVDIMMPPGPELEPQVKSQEAGLFVCRQIRRLYPDMPVFCISVVNDQQKMAAIKSMGVRYIKKGETPLRTVLELIRSRLTGVAYSTDPRDKKF